MTLLTTDFQPEQSSGFLFLNITEVISFFLHYVSYFSNSRPLSLIPSIMDISSNCSSHLYPDIPKFYFLLFHQADLSKDNTPLKKSFSGSQYFQNWVQAPYGIYLNYISNYIHISKSDRNFLCLHLSWLTLPQALTIIAFLKLGNNYAFMRLSPHSKF